MAHGPSPWPETTPKETWKFQLERWSSLIFSYQRCKSWVNLSEIDGFWLDASLATLPLVVYPLVNKHNYGKSPCLMENSLWMAIFNSYVSLPEGTSFQKSWQIIIKSSKIIKNIRLTTWQHHLSHQKHQKNIRNYHKIMILNSNVLDCQRVKNSSSNQDCNLMRGKLAWSSPWR